jgi:hypothetical protein
MFSLDFPWLGKCCVLFLLDLYIYFGFPLARLKWSYLLKLVRLPLQIQYSGGILWMISAGNLIPGCKHDLGVKGTTKYLSPT